jgi:N-acetyl sugar amidotransferase
MSNPSSTEFPCKRCLLDGVNNPDFSLDLSGLCSFCNQFDCEHQPYLQEVKNGGREKYLRILDQIRKDGRGKPYDCLIGVSGGVDSTYIAWLTKEVGLRPLAVHFDNGWNSELAVKNIENIINRLGIDLETVVVDWLEFRDLQLSYLKASVVDVEVPTDHGIFTTLFRVARRFGIRYILSGVNSATEAILPYSWIHPKLDHINLLAIHKAFGTQTLKTFPVADFRLKRWIRTSGLQEIRILDLIDFRKAEAEELIKRELDWRPYGGKHYESIFTRFYQGYILPEKFGIDKRKAHLSNLICSGQMTRDEGIAELAKPIYPQGLLLEDMEFALKKFNLTEAEFGEIMQRPRKAHRDFDFEGSIFHRFTPLKLLRPLWRKLKTSRLGN